MMPNPIASFLTVASFLFVFLKAFLGGVLVTDWMIYCKYHVNETGNVFLSLLLLANSVGGQCEAVNHGLGVSVLFAFSSPGMSKRGKRVFICT